MIVELLVQGDYDLLIKRSQESRLTSADLSKVINTYGRTLTLPPESAYDSLDVIQLSGSTDTWSVRVPLWTREEGRSDLTLMSTITLSNSEPRIEIDDLLVL